MKINYKFLIYPFLIIVCSCGSINKSRKVAGISEQEIKLSDSGKVNPSLFWAHYDATQRGSMLYIGSDKKVRILAENPPDAAIQSIVKIGAELKGVDGIGDAELAFETQKSIAELGKRTAAVNMLRDALYRLNELYYANQDATEASREKLLSKDTTYLKKLKVIEDYSSQKILEKIQTEEHFNLFEKVIESAKEIATNESEASKVVAKAESKANVEKSKFLMEKINLLKEMFEKIKDTAGEEEVKKLIDELIAIN